MIFTEAKLKGAFIIDIERVEDQRGLAAIHEMEGRAYHPEHLIQPEDMAAVMINALSLPRSADVTDLRIRPMRKTGS